MIDDLKSKTVKYKREQVRKLLIQCTVEQQEFFNRMYRSIDDILEEKMDHAYRQCQRAIKMNREKQALKEE